MQDLIDILEGNNGCISEKIVAAQSLIRAAEQKLRQLYQINRERMDTEAQIAKYLAEKGATVCLIHETGIKPKKVLPCFEKNKSVIRKIRLDRHQKKEHREKVKADRFDW